LRSRHPFRAPLFTGRSGEGLFAAGQTGTSADIDAPGLQGEIAERLSEAMASGEPPISDNLIGLLKIGAAGPYPEQPSKCVVLPIPRASRDGRAGVLIAGLSARLPLSKAYLSSCHLLGAQVSTAIAAARAYDVERRRAEALIELDKAKTVFFSSVSHEFRTPLTLMLGPLEEMLARDKGSDRRVELDLVYRNALRLLRLVNSLLDFSQIEAGRAGAAFQPVDLSELTADIASAFRSAVEKASLILTVDCPPLSEPVYVDRSMWETIVLNLVSNAFKFTLVGEIRICLRERGRGVELSVADSGIGIAATDVARLFERFYRVESTVGRSFEGTGIGLSLVREPVLLHGGSVDVESEHGAGTTFGFPSHWGSRTCPRKR
jgi:signal transduction histidine kinase